MATLLDKLMSDEVEDLLFMDHPNLIRNSGPLEQIIADAMAQIGPEALELQGRVVSPEI